MALCVKYLISAHLSHTWQSVKRSYEEHMWGLSASFVISPWLVQKYMTVIIMCSKCGPNPAQCSSEFGSGHGQRDEMRQFYMYYVTTTGGFLPSAYKKASTAVKSGSSGLCTAEATSTRVCVIYSSHFHTPSIYWFREVARVYTMMFTQNKPLPFWQLTTPFILHLRSPYYL